MSVNNVRAFVVYMPLLIHRKKCTLIKNADKWTSKHLTERRAGDDRETEQAHRRVSEG